MARSDQVGKHKTAISTGATGYTTITYHSTAVVQFNSERIILNTGGYSTYTTKLRMNQASAQFGLGYRVFQKRWNWYVQYNGRGIPFDDVTLVLNRRKDSAKGKEGKDC